MYIVLFCLLYLQIVSLHSLTKKLENDQITADCGTITVKTSEFTQDTNKLPVFVNFFISAMFSFCPTGYC